MSLGLSGRTEFAIGETLEPADTPGTRWVEGGRMKVDKGAFRWIEVDEGG